MRIPFNPWGVFAFALVSVLGGCTPSPAPSPIESNGEEERLQVLLEQNIRLTEELLEAREEVAHLKIRAALCEPEKTGAKKRSEEVNPSPALPKELPIRDQSERGTKEVEPPPCSVHLRVEAEGLHSEVESFLSQRLRGWGLERLQILKRTDGAGVDVFFNGWKGDGMRSVTQVRALGKLSVFAEVVEGLSSFEAETALSGPFAQLFPEQGKRILHQVVEGDSFVTSLHPEDIRVFAKQIGHKNPNARIVTAPSPLPGMWRSRVGMAPEIWTEKDLETANLAQDESGESLLLRFRERNPRLRPLSGSLNSTSVLFVVDEEVIHRVKLPSSARPTLPFAELRLAHLPREVEARELRRISALLNTAQPVPVFQTTRVVSEECGAP